MRGLNLESRKKALQTKEREDRKLRQQVSALLGSALSLRDLNITTRGITLVAANKTIAQELFLRKSALEKSLKREITIR